MRAPRITAENLANQVDVVSEEIRLNVLNRPYGGFPWVYLPAVLFASFANAHNGYGDFVDLQSATVEDCADFFETYYTPANAVLTVCGDFDVRQATELVDRHFDDIRGRPGAASGRPSTSRGRRACCEAEHVDPHAPAPAARRRAGGCPTRSPTLPQYLAFVALAGMLTDGESSRLQSAVVAKAGLATDIWAGPGCSAARWTPATRTSSCSARSTRRAVPAQTVIDASAEQIADLAADGPTPEERTAGAGPVRRLAVPGERRDRRPHPVARRAGAAARPGRAAQRAAGPAHRADRRRHRRRGALARSRTLRRAAGRAGGAAMSGRAGQPRGRPGHRGRDRGRCRGRRTAEEIGRTARGPRPVPELIAVRPHPAAHRRHRATWTAG